MPLRRTWIKARPPVSGTGSAGNPPASLRNKAELSHTSVTASVRPLQISALLRCRPAAATRSQHRHQLRSRPAVRSLTRHPPRDPPNRRAGQQREGGDRQGAEQSREHRSRHRQRAKRNPQPPGGPRSAQAPEPSAAEGQGEPARRKDDKRLRRHDRGHHPHAGIRTTPSISGRNRMTACTNTPAGSQTDASGRNPRGPLRTFLSISQRLTASHGGSVQAPASRREPRRERGACRKRGRRERGSGEIRNRGERT